MGGVHLECDEPVFEMIGSGIRRGSSKLIILKDVLSSNPRIEIRSGGLNKSPPTQIPKSN